LIKELEYREGMVLPHRRSVIEMPRAVNDFHRASLRPALYAKPAGVVAIRAEAHSDSRFWRVLRGSIATGILACVAVMFVVRDAHLGTRFGWTSATPRLPNFNDRDDYSSVVRKLGNPTSDHWVQSGFGTGGYRRLWYARRGMTLILTGASPDNARYSGTLNRDGEIIHSVDTDLIRELDSAPVLR
jgi:hypothetical protein